MSTQSPPRIDPVKKLVLFYMNKSALDKELLVLEQKQTDLEEKKIDLRKQMNSLLRQIDIWNEKNNKIDKQFTKLNANDCKKVITGALQNPEATIESIVEVLYKGTCANQLPAVGIKAGGSKRWNQRKKRKTRKN